MAKKTAGRDIEISFANPDGGGKVVKDDSWQDYGGDPWYYEDVYYCCDVLVDGKPACVLCDEDAGEYAREDGGELYFSTPLYEFIDVDMELETFEFSYDDDGYRRLAIHTDEYEYFYKDNTPGGILKEITSRSTGKPNALELFALAARCERDGIYVEPERGYDMSLGDADYVVDVDEDGVETVVYDGRPNAGSRRKSAQAVDEAVVDAVIDVPAPEDTVDASDWEAGETVPGSGITTYVMGAGDAAYSVATEPESVRGVDGYGWTAVDQEGRVVAEGWSEAEYEAAFEGMGACQSDAASAVAGRR